MLDGIITGISTHWGPHHGPQSATMLGVAGAGVTDGSPMFHYTGIENTCVTCHMSGPQDHKFLPDVSTCSAVCHVGATSFDIGGTQTEVQTRLDAIGTELVSLGLLSDITVDGHPTVTSAPAAQAIALYNWLYIAHEDKSLGVHNPAYTRALLVAAEDRSGSARRSRELRRHSVVRNKNGAAERQPRFFFCAGPRESRPA